MNYSRGVIHQAGMFGETRYRIGGGERMSDIDKLIEDFTDYDSEAVRLATIDALVKYNINETKNGGIELTDTQDLLKQRYYHLGENTWEELSSRVANFIYPDSKWLANSLCDAIANKKFVPSTPVLANAGSPVPMLCSCFVVPVPDDMAGIMKSLTDTVMIQKYGGGVGLDFSNIRAEGSLVKTTNGKASGPVSFMDLWNTAMNVVKQGGKRQGALMGSLSVHHPDLYHFIKAKEIEGKLTNLNISVAMDKKFFDDLESESQNPYACGFPPNQILDEIAYNIWRNGEPGMLFLDNINENNPYGIPITVTNPCGEIPTPPYGACVLGSINLNFCLDFKGKFWILNYDKLRQLVNLGVNALNGVLDKTWWPLPETAKFENAFRPIGLGVMGLADIMVKLGVVYGKSDEFLHRLFSTIRQMATDAARQYVITMLKPFNRTVLSIAPTGSIAQLAGCSYGIEPYFAMAYKKVVAAGVFYKEVQTLSEVLKARGIEYTDADRQIVLNTGSVQQTNLPDDIKLIFRTATEIPWEEHLLVQAAIQSHVDNSVSKTINLSYSTTVEEIKRIIILAHKMKLKGFTMYRQNSRNVEVMVNACPSGKCEI